MLFNKKLTKFFVTTMFAWVQVGLAMHGAAIGSLDEAVEGEFIIKLEEGVQSAHTANFFNAHSMKIDRSVNKTSGLSVLQVKPHAIVQSLGMSSLASQAAVQKEMIKQLSQLPGVSYVEPNYIYRILDRGAGLTDIAPLENRPNDPMLDQIWGMNFINAFEAWDVATGTGETIVAVIDTGVDYNHPDLVDNMWTAEDGTFGYNAINDKLDPMDDHYHGTHVAGTVGATGNNEVGVVGVTWNTRIMGVKFLSASGGGTLEDAIKAIDFATENGAHIMNNSWGGGGYSEALKEAIVRTKEADVLFVCAAGNSSNNNDNNPAYPASYQVENVLSVAAMAEGGDMAYFSNFGKRTVHIGAPGVDVQSTSTNNQYRSLSGTSMASPQVAGAAALMRDLDPEMTALELRERLIASSVKNAAFKRKIANGGAMLNVNNMVRGIFPPGPVPVPDWAWSEPVAEVIETAHPYEDNTTETWEISMEGATHYKLLFSKFELENRYDKLTIKNAETGAVLEEFTGTLPENHWTGELEAPALLIEFKSDYSVSKWGFKMDAFQWAEFDPNSGDEI